MRAIPWRVWAVGSLGWPIFIGFDMGATPVVYDALSTEEPRLQPRVDKSAPASYDRWKAGFDKRTVTRNLSQTRNELIFGAGYLFFPPLAAILMAHLVALLLSDDKDGDEGEKAASA